MSDGYDFTDGSQVAFMNKWYIQVPLHIVLLEILVACVLRIAYAILLINKYRHKREECYKPPILDETYYYGAPAYAGIPTAAIVNPLSKIVAVPETKPSAATTQSETTPVKHTKKRT